MQKIRIGNVLITCEEGTVTFIDPLRESPLRLNYDDFPLVLDLLDSTEWDRRRAFRVPVWTSSGLSTLVEYRGQTFTADTVDISLAGIMVELPEDDAPRLAVDDSVGIALRLNDTQISLSGLVRRCHGLRYGIVFPASVYGNRVGPPLALRRIVNELESQWLARRMHDMPGETRSVARDQVTDQVGETSTA